MIFLSFTIWMKKGFQILLQIATDSNGTLLNTFMHAAFIRTNSF